MKILLIPGSLREHSFNKALAKCASDYLNTIAGIETETLNYSDVPMLNYDNCYPFPESVNLIREKISEADGLWIFCPEYNGAVPGGLKNLLDFASLSYVPDNYASGSPLKGKPCAQSGAGGKMATAFAQKALSELLIRCGCQVYTEDIVKVAVPAASFKSGIYQPDPEVIKELHLEADGFIRYIHSVLAED